MRTLWQDIRLSLVMGLLLPGILLNLGAALLDREEEIVFSPPQTALPEPVSLRVKLRQEDGNLWEGDMDAYLVGVLLAEMPVSFEPEALKAQAVVARTYARKACLTGGKHGDGSVCLQSACCQAYRDPEEWLSAGGREEDLQKVRRAVAETTGLVLTYEGELIEATYFSCSGGSTEDAAAVWGTDYPYLRSVDSPGEEKAAWFSETRSFSKREFEQKLGITLTGPEAGWFGSVAYTAGGGVDTMAIGGTVFRGTELRSLLGLPSTAVSLQAQEGIITVSSRGFGHRVGMSQYGADAMAVGGSSFREILAHYYPGTTLTLTETENS